MSLTTAFIVIETPIAPVLVIGFLPVAIIAMLLWPWIAGTIARFTGFYGDYVISQSSLYSGIYLSAFLVGLSRDHSV